MTNKDFGAYAIRAATNLDSTDVWRLISEALAEYGIRASRTSTDADLSDLEASYWKRKGAFFVLVSGNRMIGTVALLPLSPDACELCRMYLAPDMRGRGLGRRLLAYGLDWMKQAGYREAVLKTASSLTEAISLYRQTGFRSDPEPCACGNCDVVMRRKL